jgi:putative RNA 2'-phosphotransferase
MNAKRVVAVSKYLSKHLRHAPEEIGLALEPGGWVAVDQLLAAAAAHGFPVTRAELDEAVRTNDKRRFTLDEAGTKIKANQGHSAEVELHLTPAAPPATLYHGTADRNRDSILAQGLHKARRHHVHLSRDIDTARTVGTRHGRPLVFAVDAARMAADGYGFWVSENGVWLADAVPPQYLRVLAEE